MKLLYFGDMHIDRQPSSRIDLYSETQVKKINEIKKLASDNNVKALLQGGDFLNKDIVSSEQLSHILEMWQGINLNNLLMEVMLGKTPLNELVDSIKNSSVYPMIGVPGNHELTGGELSSLDKTSLNLLVKSGFMSLVSKENPIILKDEEGFTVAITGSAYTHDIDGDDKSAYIVDKKLGDYHIHIVHGMLMEKSYGKKFRHTTISEIAYKTKADLTINGHDHIGYELTEVDGKKFINPGSPFRLSAEKKEMSRTPKVLILDINKDTGINVETHYLKSAEDGDKVLSRKHITKALGKSEKLEEIESALNKAHLGKGVDITDIVKKISINEKIEDDIASETIELITDKMRELDVPFNPTGDYIIENLTIQNFLSHKYSSFDFTDGLNVLYGESRSGKSSVLRAIREVYECYLRNPRNFIFHNETFFKITMTLSNGYIISRLVEKKKTGKNGYEIYDPNTGELSYYNTKAVSMVQEILGLNKIKLTEKNKIGLNFLNQGESWFFIGSGISAPDKAKLTGVVYGTHYADGVLKDINAKTKKVISQMNFYEKEIEKLQEEKLKYAYIDEFEELLLKAESDLELLEKKELELEFIQKTSEELDRIKNEEKLLNDIINKISSAKPIYENLFNSLIVSNEEYLKLVSKTKEINSIVTAGKEASFIVNKLKDVRQLKDKFNKILELNEENKVDIDLLEKYNKINNESYIIKNQIVQLENIIDKMKDISKAEACLNDMKVLSQEIESINVVKSDIEAIENEIDKNTKEINNIKDFISKSIDIYKEKLLSVGKCPVCSSSIDTIIVENLIEELNNTNN